MYTIKQTPDAFLVDEILDWPLADNGKYHLCKLSKRNLNTLQAIDIIAKKLGVPAKEIGNAGLKDKHASTTQHVTIPAYLRVSAEQIGTCNSADIALTAISRTNKALYTGALDANAFTITVTDVEGYDVTPQASMVNYFGEQRFSTKNADIGFALIRKRFDIATRLILEKDTGLSREEEVMKSHLAQHPNDHVGALRRLNKDLLTLFVHAYQSKLWNTVASALVEVYCKDWDVHMDIFANVPHDAAALIATPAWVVPIVGFDYEEDDYPDTICHIVTELLTREQVNLRDFIIPSLPEVTRAGGVRDVLVPLQNLAHERTAEGIRFSFTLAKGAYATVALRHLLRAKAKIN